jgi:hypothetical protein
VLQKAPESYSTPGVPASRRHEPVVRHCELGRAISRRKGTITSRRLFPSPAGRGDE